MTRSDRIQVRVSERDRADLLELQAALGLDSASAVLRYALKRVALEELRREELLRDLGGPRRVVRRSWTLAAEREAMTEHMPAPVPAAEEPARAASAAGREPAPPTPTRAEPVETA